jgi:GNAT superfamily N-acetyltransferase
MMTTKLRIRPALAHEGQVLAKVAAAAFLDDPFDSYMYPNRKQHYRAYQKIYQQKFDSRINQSLCWVMVAEVITQVTNENGKVSYEGATPAAYAIWTRESAQKRKAMQRRLHALGLRDPAADMSRAQQLKKRVMSCGLVEAIRDRPNPVVDRKRFAAFWEGLGDRHGLHDDGSDSDVSEDAEPDEYWHLEQLAVAPEFRRRGAARALLSWGQDWAQREDVPVLLESTPMGKPLYEEAGFLQYDVWDWGDKADMAWYMMRWQPSVTASKVEDQLTC